MPKSTSKIKGPPKTVEPKSKLLSKVLSFIKKSSTSTKETPKNKTLKKTASKTPKSTAKTPKSTAKTPKSTPAVAAAPPPPSPPPDSLVSIATTPTGSYGENSLDNTANLYLHTIRAYTGIDQYHDFKGTSKGLSKGLIDGYNEYIYREGTPATDPIYTKFMNQFNTYSNIENRFIKSIIAPYPPPFTTLGFLPMELDDIPIDTFWQEFRRQIPEYDETVDSTGNISHSMIYTRTIDLTAPYVLSAEDKSGVPIPPSVNVNRYIVSKVTLSPKRNVGKPRSGPDLNGSFAKRFFDVIDYHHHLKTAFLTSANQTAFNGHMSMPREKQDRFSLMIDTDKGVLSRLLFYDNAGLKEEDLNKFGKDLHPMDRTINYLTTRESVHDPARKQSPFTVDVVTSSMAKPRQNGNTINIFLETVEKEDLTEMSNPYVGAPYNRLSGFLQGKFCSIDISNIGVSKRTLDTSGGVELVDYTVMAQVKNEENPADTQGSVSYVGKGNEIGKIVSKIKSLKDESEENKLISRYNLLTSKRYGDQLQAFVCKNNASMIKEKQFVDVSELQSKSVDEIRTQIDDHTIEATHIPADELGLVYLSTGDKAMCGYCLLTGVDFIYSFEEEIDPAKPEKKSNKHKKKKSLYTYIFTYAGFVPPALDKDYVGGGGEQKQTQKKTRESAKPETPKALVSSVFGRPHMYTRKNRYSQRSVINTERSRKNRHRESELAHRKRRTSLMMEKRLRQMLYQPVSTCMEVPTIQSQENETLEGYRIKALLNNIICYRYEDSLKKQNNHPFVSIYLILSGIYSHMEGTLEFGEEDAVNVERLWRLTAVVNHYVHLILKKNGIDKNTEEGFYKYTKIMYAVGEIVSILLVRAVYNQALFSCIVRYMHGNTIDAEMISRTIGRTVYLNTYVGHFSELEIANGENKDAYLEHVMTLFSEHPKFVKLAFYELYVNLPSDDIVYGYQQNKVIIEREIKYLKDGVNSYETYKNEKLGQFAKTSVSSKS